MIPLFRLGTFTFVRLHVLGADRGTIPAGEMQHAALIQRPGVAGSGVVQLAVKGEPFEAESFVDLTSKANAHALADQYRAIVNAAKLILIYDDVDYETDFGLNYIALRVTNIRVKRLAAAVGGLTGGQWGLWATWTLIPVPQ
jgi:hypothetical protein